MKLLKYLITWYKENFTGWSEIDMSKPHDDYD